MNLFDKLSKMDGNAIKKNIDSVKSLVNSPQGQEFLGKLNKSDRDGFLNALNNSDSNSINARLKEFDEEKIAKELKKNPELLKMLNNLSKQK